MTVDSRYRSPAVRTALSVGALAAAMSLGGCIIIDADRWDHEGEYWDRAERNSRQMIGVHTSRVSESLAAQTGVDPDRATLITRVFSGKPAAVGGLERFDVVVAINGSDAASPRAFRNAILDTPSGDHITFTVLRRGERKDVTVTPQSAASLSSRGADDY